MIETRRGVEALDQARVSGRMHFNFIRLYCDDACESHFADVAEELEQVDFAPPAAPLNLSTFLPASKTAFFAAPVGWHGDWHPSPARNLFVVISGAWEIEASDGERRRFAAGSVLLVEDTNGKGYKSRVVSDEDSLALLVQLL